MAVIVPGPIIADIRGKVGSNTFSRNQGGLYVKANPVWEQPPSEYRDFTQECLKAVAKAWSTHLTEDQRETWRRYARSNPRPNRWGIRSLHNGYAFFVRGNFFSWWVGQTITWLEAPTIPPTGPFLWSVTRAVTPTSYHFAAPVQPFPAGQSEVILFLSDQLPTPTGQTGTRGPWRLIQYLEIPSEVLPLSQELAPVWPLADNQHRAVKAVSQWFPSGAFASTSWSQLNT